jgi:hypothetical protein
VGSNPTPSANLLIKSITYVVSFIRRTIERTKHPRLIWVLILAAFCIFMAWWSVQNDEDEVPRGVARRIEELLR